jgi:hypothetical protein
MFIEIISTARLICANAESLKMQMQIYNNTLQVATIKKKEAKSRVHKQEQCRVGEEEEAFERDL